MARLGLLVALLVALLAAPAARAADLPTTQRILARQMALAGGGAGAYVRDAASGAELFASRPDVPRVPASVEKLYTSATALLEYGPQGHLTTSIVASAAPGPEGVLAGDLVLRGGGDPTFDGVAADAAAAQLAASGLTEVTGRVVGDESEFDGLRGPPSSRYRASAYVGPLSALAFDRGRTGRRRPYWQASPARFAAEAFEKALERDGVDVAGRARQGRAPAGTVTLLEWNSPSLAELVQRMNLPSDNYMAETLVKALGAEFGGGGSTAAGAAVVRTTMARLGLRPRVVDGSGLSRGDRTSPRQVVQLLDAVSEGDAAPAFADALPVAGRSGTLVHRMRGSVAQDHCRAKTGTLIGVSALAGYCDTRSGRHVAFAFLMNGVGIAAAHRLQDRMTIALARLSS